MKESRSGIAPQNLQEVLDAESSIGTAVTKGQQQYFTPNWLADQCAARLPNTAPDTAIDPQCGDGALLAPFPAGTTKFGIDIDNRDSGTGIIRSRSRLTGNCLKIWDILHEIDPDLMFEAGVANPPFGKRWKDADSKTVDSTKATWDWLTTHSQFGYFIANHNTLINLGIAPSSTSGLKPVSKLEWDETSLNEMRSVGVKMHPWLYHYEIHAGTSLWKGMREELMIGIAFWKNPTPKTASGWWELNTVWEQAAQVLEDERKARPDFNIYLDSRGYLRTYLSVRDGIKLKLAHTEIQRLHSINECHPLTLTTDKETRTLLHSLVDAGVYRIQPAAKASIESALREVVTLACPIMPVTPFECVAYADEEESLKAKVDVDNGKIKLTKGKLYEIRTGTYQFREEFKRNKVHYSELEATTYTAEHECVLSGQDRYIQLNDDAGSLHRFMDRPVKDCDWNHEEGLLWDWFERPEVKTIAEAKPDAVQRNNEIMKSLAMIAGFNYYGGQTHYVSRIAAKDCGLAAAETGTGKTLMALTIIALKSPFRALIIAPQGTTRSSETEEEEGEEGETEYSASQWVQEIHRFAPYLQVWEIFSPEDYERICSLNGGTLPTGVYISYYQAMFLNGARERVPESWDDNKLNAWAKSEGLAKLPPAPPGEDGEVNKRHWCETVGKEVNGIRSIIAPCLSTRIGHLFDMVILDEAHVACNMSANITQMLIRLQPKYRWGLTATPIPNIVSNLFSLAGWIAVPDWYKGGVRNAAWPFSREELGRFTSTFMSTERDFTEESMRERAARSKGEVYKGKVEKASPIISSPARLLKLIKTFMAFISKEDVNPKYIKPKVIDVRVPIGKEQGALYAHFLNRGNVPGGHPLVRARRQTAWLRSICADPAGFTHGGPRVHSNLNPKVLTTMELVRDLLPKGQVLIVSSRVGLTNTIQHRLAEAGITIARIDSTIAADQHAAQANLFKSGKAQVCLMGLRCAAAYSFDQCKYEIIVSIDWSPGPFNQAKGRIDRVTNDCEKEIYCVLTKNTIEEIQYDVMATKDDAATICLRGKRVPRNYKPVDPSEILASAIDKFVLNGGTPEIDCEKKWPDLCDALRKSALTNKTPVV